MILPAPPFRPQENSQEKTYWEWVLQAADRLDRLLLIMARAMYGWVRVGPEEARDHPTPLKKIQAQTDPDH